MQFLATVTLLLFIAIHLVLGVGLIVGLCLISRQHYEQRLKLRRIAEIEEPLPLPLSLRTAELAREKYASVEPILMNLGKQISRKLMSEPVRRTHATSRPLDLNLPAQPQNPR